MGLLNCGWKEAALYRGFVVLVDGAGFVTVHLRPIAACRYRSVENPALAAPSWTGEDGIG